jgi:hypothetical protein
LLVFLSEFAALSLLVGRHLLPAAFCGIAPIKLGGGREESLDGKKDVSSFAASCLSFPALFNLSSIVLLNSSISWSIGSLYCSSSQSFFLNGLFFLSVGLSGIITWRGAVTTVNTAPQKSLNHDACDEAVVIDMLNNTISPFNLRFLNVLLFSVFIKPLSFWVLLFRSQMLATIPR